MSLSIVGEDWGIVGACEPSELRLDDGSAAAAACRTDGAASRWVVVSGAGHGRVGEAGAGGVSLAEVQACEPSSVSPLYTLEAAGDGGGGGGGAPRFAYPELSRADPRGGLCAVGADGRSHELAPELLGFEYSAAGAVGGSGAGRTSALALLVLLVVMLGVLGCARVKPDSLLGRLQTRVARLGRRRGGDDGVALAPSA